ncbi:hypothetical protein HKX48_001799, partial [Thoreauomyces humboldtii]
MVDHSDVARDKEERSRNIPEAPTTTERGRGTIKGRTTVCSPTSKSPAHHQLNFPLFSARLSRPMLFQSSLLLSALALVAAAPIVEDAYSTENLSKGTHSIPVRKNLNGNHKWVTRVAGLGSEPVTYSSISNGNYYGVVEVGTPPQSFPVTLDTGMDPLPFHTDYIMTNAKQFTPSDIPLHSLGSSDFWIYAQKGTKQTDKRLYYPGASTTNKDLNKKSSISYGDGSTSTYEWNLDTTTFGGLATNVHVGAAYLSLNTAVKASDITFTNHGILGLSWADGNQGGYLPPVQQLAKDKVIPKSLFGLYLGNEQNSTDGELTLGGVNPARYVASDLAWNPSTYAF